MSYLQRLSLLFLCLGLWGCPQKAVPLDEDMNARRAAVELTRQFFDQIQAGEIEALAELTRDPFWLDGEIVDRAELIREIRENQSEVQGWEILDIRFFSAADLKIFGVRTLERLRRHGLPHEYFTVARLRERDRIEHLLFALEFVEGQWRLAGFDD